MKKLYFTMAFIGLLLLHLSNALATRRAMLVGIGDYKELPAFSRYGMSDLKGPRNDVQAFREALISRYGFSESEILVLLDEKASYKGIKTAFDEWLVKGTQPGDTAVFYFSGHGSRVPDLNGDEDDGFDEVLCPYDMVPVGGANIIIDDEMGLWLDRLKGRTTVVVLDSCYSGGAVRSIGNKTVSILENTDATRSRFLPITDYQPSPIALSSPKGVDIPPTVILLAAAREFEPAMELRLPNGFYGGFTFGLCEAMKTSSGNSYQKLFDHARKVVKDRLRLAQDPQMMAAEKLAVLLPFKDIRLAPPLKPEPAKPATTINPSPSSSTGTSALPAASPSAESNKPTRPPEVVGEKVLVALDEFNGWSQAEINSLKEGLSRLPIVQLVDQSAFFDRLIRGEKSEGAYKVRVTNSIGDANHIEPSASVEEVVKRLGNHMEYAFTAKQFAKIHHPNPRFKVKVWVTDQSRRDFELGEKIVFGVVSEKNAHILLLNLDGKGDYHVIYPNRYHPQSLTKAKAEVLIPNSQMQSSEFDLVIGEPVGEETIKVIASTEPLISQKLVTSELADKFKTFSGKAKTDFINGVVQALSSPGFEWSEDTIVIRSHEIKK